MTSAKALLVTCALAGAIPTASAQDWPTRPITLVVPFAAGGPVDVAARLIAPRVGESLGQQIVIENMAGAGGMTGSNRVAKATPDGYLLVLGNAGTHAYNQSLYKRPLYIPRPSSRPPASCWRTPRCSSCARTFRRAACPNSSPP
jgi:tripartite-type tricarboxylate transporter receptor subunit TctC